MRKNLVQILVLVTIMRCAMGHTQQLVPHDLPDTIISMGCSNVAHVWRFMDLATPLTDWVTTPCGSKTATSLAVTGTVTYQQAGYDSTTTNSNASAKFAVGAKAVASASTTGDLSFNSPGGFEVVFVPNLNGTLGSNLQYSIIGKSPSINNLTNTYSTGTNGWGLYLQNLSGLPYLNLILSANANSVAGGGGATACFTYYSAYSSGASGTGAITQGQIYDVTVSWPGDRNCSNIIVTINGAKVTPPSYNYNNTGSFTGIYKTTVTAGGSGYLSGGSGTFAVTYTGGGCTTEPTGLANVTSGAVTSVTNSSSYLFGVGCTSAPTPVFTAGGGTGATGNSTLNLFDISDTSAGVMTLGDFSSTAWTSGSTMSYAFLAIYPNGLTPAEYQQHFAATDYYRNYLPTKPSSPTPIVVVNDPCSDIDGSQQLWVLERLQQIGYVKILAYVNLETATDGPQYAQYLLARAGMFGTPMLQTTITGDGTNSYCGPALAAATSAPTISRSSYPAPNPTLTSILTAQANGSVLWFDGSASTTTAAFLGYSGGTTLFTNKVKAYYCQCMNGTAASGSGGFNWGLDPTSTASLLTLQPTTGVPLYANGILPNGTNATGTCNLYPVGSMPYESWYYWGSGSCAAGTDGRMPYDTYSTVISWLFPSWFISSANGTFTYVAGNNTYTWSSSIASNQYYVSGLAIDNIKIISFISSLLWSDPAYFSMR